MQPCTWEHVKYEDTNTKKLLLNTTTKIQILKHKKVQFIAKKIATFEV